MQINFVWFERNVNLLKLWYVCTFGSMFIYFYQLLFIFESGQHQSIYWLSKIECRYMFLVCGSITQMSAIPMRVDNGIKQDIVFSAYYLSESHAVLYLK